MALAGIAKVRIPEFRRQILAWFDANARDLPWRRTQNPYLIWVSEIMLQQTRVAAVLEHYARFTALFPSVVALAHAPEEDVLAAWSGLGYYRRPRMMHRAAQAIVRDHGGKLPRTVEGLRELPGIGEYTAAAVASIAFGKAAAVVDGNVVRVIQRIFSENEVSAPNAVQVQRVREHANALLDLERPGDFNQSMMELGATVCLPRNPLCLTCPVRESCGTQGEHPVEPRKQMRIQEIAYLFQCRSRAGVRQVLLEQRSGAASQMPGMWELPEIAIQPEERDSAALTLRHSITVTNYHVRVLRLSEQEGKLRMPGTATGRKWVNLPEIEKLPLTGLARKILRRLDAVALP